MHYDWKLLAFFVRILLMCFVGIIIFMILFNRKKLFMAFKLIQPNNGIYHIGQCSKKIIWTLHYKYCCNFSWIKMKSIMFTMFFFRDGGTPICRWISSACQWTPFFYTDLTPNDPLFCSGHTQWPPFFHSCIEFCIHNCKFSCALHAFWEIYKFCGHFNTKFANNLQILHTKWPPIFGSPHRMTLFFQQNLTPNAPTFVLQVGTCTSLSYSRAPPPRVFWWIDRYLQLICNIPIVSSFKGKWRPFLPVGLVLSLHK